MGTAKKTWLLQTNHKKPVPLPSSRAMFDLHIQYSIVSLCAIRKSKEPQGRTAGEGTEPLTALASSHTRALIRADLAAVGVSEN